MIEPEPFQEAYLFEKSKAFRECKLQLTKILKTVMVEKCRIDFKQTMPEKDSSVGEQLEYEADEVIEENEDSLLRLTYNQQKEIKNEWNEFFERNLMTMNKQKQKEIKKDLNVSENEFRDWIVKFDKQKEKTAEEVKIKKEKKNLPKKEKKPKKRKV